MDSNETEHGHQHRARNHCTREYLPYTRSASRSLQMCPRRFATVPLGSEGLTWRGLISALLMHTLNVGADDVTSTDMRPQPSTRICQCKYASRRRSTLKEETTAQKPQGTSPDRRILAVAPQRWCLGGPRRMVSKVPTTLLACAPCAPGTAYNRKTHQSCVNFFQICV